jgi:hypothetical protein
MQANTIRPILIKDLQSKRIIRLVADDIFDALNDELHADARQIIASDPALSEDDVCGLAYSLAEDMAIEELQAIQPWEA